MPTYTKRVYTIIPENTIDTVQLDYSTGAITIDNENNTVALANPAGNMTNQRFYPYSRWTKNNLAEAMLSGDPWELQIKFKASASAGTLGILWSTPALNPSHIGLTGVGGVRMTLSLNGSTGWSYDKTVTAGWTLNTINWVKLTFAGSNDPSNNGYQVWYSSDGINFTEIMQYQTQYVVTIPNNKMFTNLMFNCAYTSSWPFYGLLYLDGCYFKCNNELLWQPCSSDGPLVFYDDIKKWYVQRKGNKYFM